MDPRMLLAPESPLGYPAPFWFLELFKVLGFWLHMGPMHLWYAGSIIAVLLAAFGSSEARTTGRRIIKALPLTIALGINFGVVPLLFAQVAYYQFFYAAGTLIAWPWLSVIGLLIVAYYGTYLHVLRLLGHFPRKVGSIAGWIAALAFVAIGFIFANNFSLMTNVSGWFDIFRKANIAGSPTGLALNVADPTLLHRWLFMFGMAITTVGAYIIVDCGLLAGRESEDYKRFAPKLAWWLYTFGLIWFIAAGSLYIFGTRMEYVRMALANPIMRILFPLTMLSPGLPWLLITLQRKGTTRRLSILTLIAQLGVLALNAISRQWVQNMELAPYRNLLSTQVNNQPGAIAFFLIVFALGLAIVGWMISKIVRANRQEQLV